MISFDELVKAFCQENHLHLPIGEQKAVFVLNQKYEVTIEELGDQSFVLYATLDLTASERQTASERLLKANAFGKQTLRGVFALDPKSERVLFFRRFDKEIVDLSHFKVELNCFLTVLNHWDNELKR